MARPRTPAAETPPAAPPLVSKDSLPPADTFRDYRKTTVTSIAGPFEPPVEIATVQGTITVTEPTFIGLDSEGHPYPVVPDVLAATYALVATLSPEEDASPDEALKRAFEEGVAEGVRRATVKELPLFERAKQLARDLAAQPVETLRERIAELQEERGEQLVRSDLDLVLGVHRRLRAHQAQRDEAIREPGRPRRPVPRERQQPKQTEYEHLS